MYDLLIFYQPCVPNGTALFSAIDNLCLIRTTSTSRRDLKWVEKIIAIKSNRAVGTGYEGDHQMFINFALPVIVAGNPLK